MRAAKSAFPKNGGQALVLCRASACDAPATALWMPAAEFRGITYVRLMEERNGSQRALIVGLGISGMAMAKGLHECGWDVTVVERAPERRRGGYFVGLFAVGKVAAKQLGFNGMRNRAPKVRDNYALGKNGEKRRGLGFGDLPGDPWLLLRSDIENAAYEAIDALDPKIDVRYSTVPTRIEQDGAGVDVWLKDSSDGTESRERYDLLVGADGVHSTVRKLVFGPDEKYIRHLGYMIVASQIPEDLPGLERGQGATFAEAGKSLWVFPFEDRPATVMFSYKADDVAAEFAAASPAARIREVYGPRVAPTVKAAIDQLERADESLFDEAVQVRMDRWHEGRVVLMGDAGWCLTLYSRMGASTALASANLLTAIIGQREGDVAGALEEWEARSRPFIRHYQKVGARNRAFFTPAGRAGGTARALAMSVFKRPWGRSLLAAFVGTGGKGNKLMKSVIPARGRTSPSRPRE